MTVVSSGGKIVAFSAVRSNDASNGPENHDNAETPKKPPGTPILLQVSMVTTTARPMTFDEYEKFIQYILKSKSTLQDLFKKGKDFYEKHNIKGKLTAIAGVANIVSGVMKFLPEKQDPMVQNLANLEKDVKQLSEKLNDNFNEMKAFISQQSFFTNIMSPTSVLTRHMRDCIKTPGDDAKENFLKAYKANKPLKLQYDLNSYLKQQTTNPLKLSMNAEKVKTKAIFEKWEDIISRVMAQFLILEAFAGGLLDSKSETNMNRLMTASDEIFTNMDSWKEEYKKDQGYWNELKEFLEPYIENHTYLNNYQKASELKEKLDSYLTSDTFYVCVFNEVKWNRDYFYICDNEKDQIIGAWRKGKCNCFIYRSRQGSTVSQDDHQSLIEKVTKSGSKNLRWTGNLQSVIQNQLLDQGLLPDNGFICLFFNTCDVEILHSVSPPPSLLRYGPGYYSFAFMDGSDVSKIMTIMASFP